MVFGELNRTPLNVICPIGVSPDLTLFQFAGLVTARTKTFRQSNRLFWSDRVGVSGINGLSIVDIDD